MTIDTAFDFRTDARGRDPDFASPTLRQYHRRLWGRCLPDGASFDLSVATRRVYLHHHSKLGEFFPSSDAVMQTFINWPMLRSIIERFPKAEREYRRRSIEFVEARNHRIKQLNV